eukprot:m.3972 g.3972  ORF g.3972 m.3972 type:complete len:416 (+) comp10030_c0_seq1:125-1372(+)
MSYGSNSTLILDNGAFTTKVGLSSALRPQVAPNCITKAKSERRRTFISSQIDDCRDLSGLFFIYPHQKGYLINWDIEKRIWCHLLGKEGLDVNTHALSFILTEPCFNFTSIQESLNEIAFEEFQFKSFYRCPAPILSAAAYRRLRPTAACCCVVDAGFSFTHIVPTYQGLPIGAAVRRIDVGGKVLTNHLKDVVSYRQLNVMDETHVISQAKEDVCYVSMDLAGDMAMARRRDHTNSIVRDYLLPDFSGTRRGYIRPTSGGEKLEEHQQIIRFTNERFSIPEILFSPSDIGIRQCGIPEAIIKSIQATPEILHPHLYGNIVVTGGSAALPNFRERVFRDVRALVPGQYDVNVWLPPDPVTYAWEGGKALVESGEFEALCVTQRDVKEFGMGVCQRRFRVEADLGFIKNWGSDGVK